MRRTYVVSASLCLFLALAFTHCGKDAATDVAVQNFVSQAMASGVSMGSNANSQVNHLNLPKGMNLQSGTSCSVNGTTVTCTIFNEVASCPGSGEIAANGNMSISASSLSGQITESIGGLGGTAGCTDSDGTNYGGTLYFSFSGSANSFSVTVNGTVTASGVSDCSVFASFNSASSSWTGSICGNTITN